MYNTVVSFFFFCLCVAAFRGRRRSARSVFDGFRDFQAEASKFAPTAKHNNNSSSAFAAHFPADALT